MAKAQISIEVQKQIIDLYLKPSMLTDVVNTFKHFGITRKILYRILKENNIPLHSKEIINELRKKTYLEHFGVEHPMLSNEVKDKIKVTCNLKYGVDNPSQSTDVKNKVRATYISHYGVDNPNKATQIKEKKKQTCLDKYGVSSPFEDNEARNKAKQTYIAHFGVDNPQKNKDIHNKTKMTMLTRYGVDNFTKTPEYIEKTKATCLQKYGTEHYSQTTDFHKNYKKHFIYNNQSFDSFPELAFYLYNIKMNNQIERCPLTIKYIVENKIHYYIPDFKVNNQLIEIKGDLFKSDEFGWKNPFDNSIEAQQIAAEKYRTAVQNNVKILYKEDYQKYIDWFYDNNYNIEDYTFE